MSITIAKNRVKRLGVGAVAAAVLVLSGCSTGTLNDDYSAPGSDPQYEQYEIQQDQEAEQSEDEYVPDGYDDDQDGVPDWKQEAEEYDEALNEQNRLRGEAEGRGDEWSRLTGGDEFEERCEYDPTMNNNWHDDMVCDGQRLYLRPNDDFADRDELERSARKWIAKH